jgi:hypothetical protein
LIPCQAFDRQLGYKQEHQESFAYCHATKNGRVEAIREQARAMVEQEQEQLEKVQQQHQVPEREQQRRGRCIRR